jgi:hypothetical protein
MVPVNIALSPMPDLSLKATTAPGTLDQWKPHLFKYQVVVKKLSGAATWTTNCEQRIHEMTGLLPIHS